MAMKLLETTISKTIVRMRFADEPMTEWLDFQVKLADLQAPSDRPGEQSGKPFGDPDWQESNHDLIVRVVGWVRMAGPASQAGTIAASSRPLRRISRPDRPPWREIHLRTLAG